LQRIDFKREKILDELVILFRFFLPLESILAIRSIMLQPLSAGGWRLAAERLAAGG